MTKCRARAPAVKIMMLRISTSTIAVPKSGPMTTSAASQAVTIPHGRNVRQKSPSSPARFSRKYPRKMISASFDISDGCIEKPGNFNRSEEHTSELQSPRNLVCRLLLEKNKEQIAAGPQRRDH